MLLATYSTTYSPFRQVVPQGDPTSMAADPCRITSPRQGILKTHTCDWWFHFQSGGRNKQWPRDWLVDLKVSHIPPLKTKRRKLAPFPYYLQWDSPNTPIQPPSGHPRPSLAIPGHPRPSPTPQSLAHLRWPPPSAHPCSAGWPSKPIPPNQSGQQRRNLDLRNTKAVLGPKMTWRFWGQTA